MSLITSLGRLCVCSSRLLHVHPQSGSIIHMIYPLHCAVSSLANGHDHDESIHDHHWPMGRLNFHICVCIYIYVCITNHHPLSAGGEGLIHSYLVLQLRRCTGNINGNVGIPYTYVSLYHEPSPAICRGRGPP